jgi:ribonuclease P protein component
LNCYEKTISAVENPPQTAARFFKSQFKQERQGHLTQSPPSGPETLDASLSRFCRRMAANPPGRLRFNRAQRIKRGGDFARLRQQGERVTIGCLVANWQRAQTGAASRLGVITPGRIGGAVIRSRARRLLRESFRLHQNRIAQPIDLVLVARPSIARKGLVEVEKDFLTSLRKAGLLKGSTQP